MNKLYCLHYYAATDEWTVSVVGKEDFVSYDLEDCLDYIRGLEL